MKIETIEVFFPREMCVLDRWTYVSQRWPRFLLQSPFATIGHCTHWFVRIQ